MAGRVVGFLPSGGPVCTHRALTGNSPCALTRLTPSLARSAEYDESYGQFYYYDSATGTANNIAALHRGMLHTACATAPAGAARRYAWCSSVHNVAAQNAATSSARCDAHQRSTARTFISRCIAAQHVATRSTTRSDRAQPVSAQSAQLATPHCDRHVDVAAAWPRGRARCCTRRFETHGEAGQRGSVRAGTPHCNGVQKAATQDTHRVATLRDMQRVASRTRCKGSATRCNAAQQGATRHSTAGQGATRLLDCRAAWARPAGARTNSHARPTTRSRTQRPHSGARTQACDAGACGCSG
jgi:hypothetical protein